MRDGLLEELELVTVRHLLLELRLFDSQVGQLLLADAMRVDSQVGHDAKWLIHALAVADVADAFAQIDRSGPSFLCPCRNNLSLLDGHLDSLCITEVFQSLSLRVRVVCANSCNMTPSLLSTIGMIIN